MSMTDAFKPSILISETHFPYRNIEEVIADAVEQIAEEAFFTGVEIPVITKKSDRKRIGRIVRTCKFTLTMWVTWKLAEEKLNISSIDETLRKKSITRLKEYLAIAVECGASRFALVSGTDPGASVRAEAIECLHTSLCELCEAGAAVDSLQIVLEPLDRGAHKNGLIGPTNEFVPLINRIRQLFDNISISWDTAHIALCGDDVFESLTASQDLIDGIHLSNAVLDPSNKMFGDHHIRIGKPGFLTIEMIASIFEKAKKIGIFKGCRPCVSVRGTYT